MFANDTKLCAAVTTLEGKEAIQRDLERFVGRACVNFMKFNKVLKLGWGSLKHKSRLGGERNESSPEKKDLGKKSI